VPPKYLIFGQGVGRRLGWPAGGEFSWKPGQALRWGVVGGTILALTYLSSHRRVTEYGDLREGTVARERIVAPFTFWVKKGQAEHERDLEKARRSVPLLMIFDPSAGPAQVASLDSLFRDLLTFSRAPAFDSSREMALKREARSRAIPEDALRILLGVERVRGVGAVTPEQVASLRGAAREVLTGFYASGIVGDKSDLIEEGEERVSILKGDAETVLDLEDLRDVEGVAGALPDLIRERWPEANPALVRVFYEVLQAFIAPNLIPDAPGTEERRESVARSVSPNRYAVLENQKIIDANERVTGEHLEMLRALAEEKFRRRYEDPYTPYLLTFSALLLSTLVVTLLLLYLHAFRPSLHGRAGVLLLFGILLLIPASVASYLAAAPGLSHLYVPVALSAMLAALLFDTELGIAVATLSAFLCGVMLNSLPAAFASALCGAVGSYSVRQVRHRHHFNRSIVYLVFSYAVVVVALRGFLYTYSEPADFFRQMGRDLVPGLVMGVLTPVLTLGLSPIFENLFGIVTPITLLELSDLNRPLMRTMATRAPGTYTHSVIVANLSEAAAEAVNANALLARVACYYHDIGKMVRPQYFVENQSGENPHDELQPQMSALVLISHVREGLQIGEQEGLPQIILDIIPQHHGTSQIAYFKHRALERGMKDEIRDEDFRYPGPKPQTREAGIVMLADSVEGAVRSLKERSPSRVKGVVRTLIEAKFTSGELDECDLTLRDLHKIEGAFLPILMGMMHSRVEYPWQKQKAEREGREKEPKGAKPPYPAQG
jgi:putative nucleotidyltransferase with HDIG domain